MKSISNTSAMRQRTVAPGRRRMTSMILLTRILLLSLISIVLMCLCHFQLNSPPTGAQVTWCHLGVTSKVRVSR